MTRRPFIAYLLVSVCLAIAGCTTDMVQKHEVSPEAVPAPGLIIPDPDVTRNEGILTVSGAITREEGNDQLLMGKVRVYFLDSTGVLLDKIDASLKPHSIPVAGERSSRYSVNFMDYLPPGAIVQVTFVPDHNPATRPTTAPTTAPMTPAAPTPAASPDGMIGP